MSLMSLMMSLFSSNGSPINVPVRKQLLQHLFWNLFFTFHKPRVIDLTLGLFFFRLQPIKCAYPDVMWRCIPCQKIWKYSKSGMNSSKMIADQSQWCNHELTVRLTLQMLFELQVLLLEAKGVPACRYILSSHQRHNLTGNNMMEKSVHRKPQSVYRKDHE